MSPFLFSSGRAVVLVLLLAGAGLSGQTITLWNFNSATPDNNNTTGSQFPLVGNGTISAVGGASIQSSYRDASAFGGSSDPAPADNSALQIAGFAAQGTGNRTSGVEFDVSTAGFSNVTLRFDQYRGPASSAYVRVEYSLNGTDFTDMTLTGASTSGGMIFASYLAQGSDASWLNGFAIDFSSITGATDNPLFKIRLLSEFQPSDSTYYAASTLTPYNDPTDNNYWAFDMVQFSGTAIAIPEPSATALGFGVLSALGVARYRMRKSKRILQGTEEGQASIN